MKKSNISIAYSAERLEAIRHYTAEKGVNLDADLEEALHRLYEKYVPKDVRGFLEMRERATPAKAVRSATRTAPSSVASSGNFTQGGQSE